jgi:hypothetical protein
MGDDFSEPVKRNLALRTGGLCSSPECRALTSGPQDDPAKAVNVGVAAHITAASPGGPRYDTNLAAEERSLSSNGIWLCQTHAKLIDNDVTRFSVEVLKKWKADAEAEAKARVGKTAQTYLGISGMLEQPVEELARKTREATSEVLDTWSRRTTGKPLIELQAVTISPDGKSPTDVFNLGDFQRAMNQGRHVVIESPAGRGKTTTLVQLAAQHGGTGNLAFLVDLPAWVRLGTDILHYIAGRPAFQSRSINAEALARLHKAEHFSFLLNGWNEVGESDSERAVQAIRELERDFPAAGILIATRTHHIVPPLQRALRTRLLPVNRAQRKRYLDQRLGDKADALRAKLDGDPVLDELTQTPLILSEVATIFEAGAPIPQTKMGVLESVMRLLEQSEEQASHLEMEPLSGRAHDYLGALAATMTEQGAVNLQEYDARAIVYSVAAKLRAVRQIAALPEPQSVLNALCYHQVLERLTYPTNSFRFAHQQFQEFHAALLLKRQLLEFIGKSDSQEICEYTKKYLNEPAWSEPLRMIANELGVLAA